MLTEKDWRNLKMLMVLSFWPGSEALTISLAINLKPESVQLSQFCKIGFPTVKMKINRIFRWMIK